MAAYVQHWIAEHQAEKNGPVDVHTAANLAMQLAYNNKNALQAGLIIAGWDQHKGGSVYAIPLGGTLLKVWGSSAGRRGILVLWVGCTSCKISNVLAWQGSASCLHRCCAALTQHAPATLDCLIECFIELMLQVPYSIGGSGSAYITGWCDKHFREDFTAEEAHAFVRQALTHAMARDSSSGGCIRTVTITSSGVKRDFLPGSQVPATFGELQTPQQRVTA